VPEAVMQVTGTSSVNDKILNENARKRKG